MLWMYKTWYYFSSLWYVIVLLQIIGIDSFRIGSINLFMEKYHKYEGMVVWGIDLNINFVLFSQMDGIHGLVFDIRFDSFMIKRNIQSK